MNDRKSSNPGTKPRPGTVKEPPAGGVVPPASEDSHAVPAGPLGEVNPEPVVTLDAPNVPGLGCSPVLVVTLEAVSPVPEFGWLPVSPLEGVVIEVPFENETPLPPPNPVPVPFENTTPPPPDNPVPGFGCEPEPPTVAIVPPGNPVPGFG